MVQRLFWLNSISIISLHKTFSWLRDPPQYTEIPGHPWQSYWFWSPKWTQPLQQMLRHLIGTWLTKRKLKKCNYELLTGQGIVNYLISTTLTHWTINLQITLINAYKAREWNNYIKVHLIVLNKWQLWRNLAWQENSVTEQADHKANPPIWQQRACRNV